MGEIGHGHGYDRGVVSLGDFRPGHHWHERCTEEGATVLGASQRAVCEALFF